MLVSLQLILLQTVPRIVLTIGSGSTVFHRQSKERREAEEAPIRKGMVGDPEVL